MFWLKWLLKLVIDVQNPVEVVGTWLGHR
jgi:hypothetical protein